MESTRDDKQLMLVRAAPGTPTARRAARECKRILESGPDEMVVFFHGEGVLHAAGKGAGEWTTLAENPALKLEVCRSAWKRRNPGEIELPFQLSSLVQFWHHASGASHVHSHGNADDS